MDNIPDTSEHLPYPDGFETTTYRCGAVEVEHEGVVIDKHYETAPTPWQDWCLAERRAIFEQATARMLPCPAEYADSDILTRWENMERRDVLLEMESELLDFINYAASMTTKIRVMRDYLNR